MKKKLIGSIVILMLLIFFTSCSKEGKAIKTVKRGYFPLISEVTIEKGSDRFLINPEYTAFDGNDGYYYVNISGECDVEKLNKGFSHSKFISSMGDPEEFEKLGPFDHLKDSNIIFQYYIDLKTKDFGLNAISVDGIEQSLDYDSEEYWLLLLFADSYDTLAKYMMNLTGLY